MPFFILDIAFRLADYLERRGELGIVVLVSIIVLVVIVISIKDL